MNIYLEQLLKLSMYGIFTYIYHKNQLNVGKWMVWIVSEHLDSMKNSGFGGTHHGPRLFVRNKNGCIYSNLL